MHTKICIVPNEAPTAPNPGVPGLPNGIDIPADPWPKAGVDVPITTKTEANHHCELTVGHLTILNTDVSVTCSKEKKVININMKSLFCHFHFTKHHYTL